MEDTRKEIMKKMKEMLMRAGRLLGLVRGNSESGMATAEYAVGTVATISLGSILIGLFTSPEFRDAIWQLILWIISIITGIKV